MVLMYRCLKPIVYLLFFILVISGGVEIVDAQVKSIKIRLSYKSKVDGNFNVKKFKLNHPLKISQKEIINHLVSLRYKGISIGSKETGVFSPAEIKKLAPILVKAFASVPSRKIIHVDLKSKTGTTVVDIFSFKNYLNWRFDSIQGETFFQKNNARAWNIFAWKLMPQKGQLYFKSGPDRGRRLNKNWIVAKLDLPVLDKKDEKKRGPSDLSKNSNSSNKLNLELERKLKHLKRLYEEGLIEEEEYKVQQNKLFERLF